MKPFEIFRSGSHQPLKGDAIAFADGDLAAIAAAYDPTRHQAPIVIGHPAIDAPAYGWIDGLSVKGDRLVATPGDVDPAFADLVREGKFRKVSASFFQPNAANNPTPGQMHLRHVGFLGAAAPAVKGLRPIEFGEADDGIVTIEFSDWDLSQTAGTAARIFRRLRDWLIADKGLDLADQLIPDWDITSLDGAAVRAATSADDVPPAPSFSDPKDPPMQIKTQVDAAEIERRAAELATRETAIAQRERDTAEAARKARATEDAAFVGSIVQAGRLPSGLQAQATALFAELGDDTLSFADGSETREMTPREAFRDLLGQLPQPVQPGEIATADGTSPIDFSDQVEVTAAILEEISKAAGRGETLSPADALGRLHLGAGK